MVLKNKHIEQIPDSLGNLYYGIKVSEEEILPYINELSFLPRKFFNNRFKRDGKDYHITISHKKKINYDIDEVFDIDLIGIGNLSYKYNQTFFIVCESEKLDSFMNKNNLKKINYHITLAFDRKDVFRGAKDRSSIQPFRVGILPLKLYFSIKLLRNYFMRFLGLK